MTRKNYLLYLKWHDLMSLAIQRRAIGGPVKTQLEHPLTIAKFKRWVRRQAKNPKPII